jgi:hypothetical protein
MQALQRHGTQRISVLNALISCTNNEHICDMLSRIATAARPMVRQMSGDAAQAAKDANMWKYVGFAATAGSLAFAGVKVSTHFHFFGNHFAILNKIVFHQVSAHLSHDHHIEDPIKYPYLRKRDKAFPWDCKDCTLFDGACKVLSPLILVLFTVLLFVPGCCTRRSPALISPHPENAA